MDDSGYVPCPNCDGKGGHYIDYSEPGGEPDGTGEICHYCLGKGKVMTESIGNVEIVVENLKGE